MLEPDYFARKRRELGMDRQDTLAQIQALVDGWYPGKVRVRQLHNGVLRIATSSAGVASELRMRQLELLAHIEAVAPSTGAVRLAIQIGALD